MAKVAWVSACLVGLPVAYDGRHRFNPAVIDVLKDFDRVLVICPEKDLYGVPRLPMELSGGDGRDFLKGRAKLITQTGELSNKLVMSYLTQLRETALQERIETAFLKDKSPFCGVCKIYDGTFSGRLIKGKGILAAMLNQMGIELVGID